MATRLFAVVVLLASAAMGVRAQHAEASNDSGTATAPASRSAATTQHAQAQAASPTAVSKPLSSKTTARPTDMRAVVDRIQRRIDEELPATRAVPSVAKPARASAAAGPTPPPNTRVHLVWRVSLVWPDELTEQP